MPMESWLVLNIHAATRWGLAPQQSYYDKHAGHSLTLDLPLSQVQPCQDTHLSGYSPVRILTCQDTHLSGYSPVGILTCQDTHLSGYSPVRILTCQDTHLASPRKVNVVEWKFSWNFYQIYGNAVIIVDFILTQYMCNSWLVCLLLFTIIPYLLHY